MASGMRRSGRELAIKIIYSFDGVSNADALLGSFWNNFRFRDDVLGEPLEDISVDIAPPMREFAENLVRGVAGNLDKIDDLIGEYSTNWSLERMAKVDLAILRMATYELLCHLDVPVSVVINEAVEIGKRYGTKETPAFVNGILDRISRTCRPVAAP
ncbi:MAG: transcription antitermination protein NusB [Desulfuromonadales bacterium]|jgi:N utilization substance protein B|nr:transcription antitermination protein NusB [Desulfuromonadales bacterium]